MDRDFYSVSIPEPTTILGLRLRPLSLGHLVILHRIKSSFVTDGELFTPHDLALSVLVCSLDYKSGCDLFNEPNLPELFTKWHDKLTGRGWMARIGLRKPKPIDYAAKSAEFAKYLSDGSTGPGYTFNDSEFSEIDCPSVQLIKVSLMRDIGFSEAEIMDRAWSLCLWDFVTLRALSGQVKMVNIDKLRAAQQAANELQERINSGAA